MSRYQIGPVSDASPNQYTPQPVVSSHYLNVDEDPNDGDTSVLKCNAVGDREAFSVDTSAIPIDAIITNVTIRSAKKASTAGDQTYRVGIIASGLTFYGHSWILGAGSNWSIKEDSWAEHPVTGLPWTKATLAQVVFFHEQVAQAAGLPRPALSECVMFADAAVPANRPTASIFTRAPRAAIVTRSPRASIKVKGAS